MKSSNTRLIGWPLALALALAPAAPLFAADQQMTQTQDRTQEMKRLMQQIQKDTKMSKSDLEGLDPELGQYLRLHGDADHVRATIRAGWEDGCRGACTAEMVGAMNRLMLYGMQDQEAASRVQTMVREQARLQSQQRGTVTDLQLQQQQMQQLRIRTQEQARQYDEARQQWMNQQMQQLQQREMNRLQQGDMQQLQQREMERLQQREMQQLQEREMQQLQQRQGTGGGGQGQGNGR